MMNVSMKALAYRYRRGLGAIVIGFFLLFVVNVVFAPQTHAQGGAGGGGNGTGCVSYCTDNGFGWRKFSSSGNGPRGNGGRGFLLSSPYTWAQVSSICRSYNAESVYVFVADHGSNGTAVGLNYRTGDYGASYISRFYSGDVSIGGAYNEYVTAINRGIAGTAGLTWGSNIAWFCSTAVQPWSVSVSSTANRTTAEPGDTITWTHTIVNNGPSRTNANISWGSQDRGTWPNGPTPGGNWVMGAGGNSASNQTSYTVLPTDYGKNLCRSTSASPSTDTGGSIESAPACLSVMKKPKVQIKGGDLWALGPAVGMGNVTTTTSTKDGLVYGSSSEYAIVALGTVTGMASGSGYAYGTAGALPCSVSLLTLNNATTASCTPSTPMGRYAAPRVAQTVATKYPTTAATGTVGGTVNITASNLQGIYQTSGSINVTMTGALGASRWVVINAGNNDITITGNLVYTPNPLTSIQQIPQVILIARNIIIADTVSQVDAWLVATGINANGIINTCGAGGVTQTTLPTGAQCATKLTVNGPVIANHLILRRTAGADPTVDIGSPAEVFNIRPDAYLWAIGRQIADNAPILRTNNTKEVPPRY